MITFLCDFIFIIFALIYFPYVLMKGKWHAGFWQRMGFFPGSLRRDLAEKPNIWFHAVSVGEVMAVAGLIEKVRARYPGSRVVLSTVTTTGYSIACRTLNPEDRVIYAPLDFSATVRTFIAVIRPRIYVTAETEIWPNLFTALARRDIAIVVVNGRISDKSFYGYRKVAALLLRVLKGVKAFCMQSELDADRIMALGARPRRVFVVGSMKFDDTPPPLPDTLPPLNFENKEWLWIAGSTHPGEEKIMLDIAAGLRKEFPRLSLVIAPRHIERTEEVMTLVGESGFKAVRFSQASGRALSPETVVVVDTIGHLRSLYALARVVFVGKSLTAEGGQNIIEPAFFGKAIVIGPHMENFRGIAEVFLEADSIVQVSDARDLNFQMRRLLGDPSLLDLLGRRAKIMVTKHRGATAKTAEIISGLLAAVPSNEC